MRSGGFQTDQIVWTDVQWGKTKVHIWAYNDAVTTQYFFEKTKKCKKGFLLVHAQRIPPEALHSWFYILKKLRKKWKIKKSVNCFGGLVVYLRFSYKQNGIIMWKCLQCKYLSEMCIRVCSKRNAVILYNVESVFVHICIYVPFARWGVDDWRMCREPET